MNDPGYFASVTEGGDGSGASPKVLCGHYNRRGWLDDEVYAADVAYAATVSAGVVQWYHSWAIPMVKVLERNKALEAAVFPFVWLWANSMALIMSGRKETP
jgi:hypothetical protein